MHEAGINFVDSFMEENFFGVVIRNSNLISLLGENVSVVFHIM